MYQHTDQHSGVTFIEILVTVAIVAILAAVAYPSYTNHVQKAHRIEAKSALLQIQVAQEKYFLQNNTYASSLSDLNIGFSGSSPTTSGGYYTLSYSVGSPATSYTVTATATTLQSADTQCNSFTINETGSRTAKDNSNTASSECW